MCYFYFNECDKNSCQDDNESSRNDKKGSQEERECHF